MVDNLTPNARSAVMRSVRQKDTAPERRVRSAIHRAGYRFRLHRHDLPGTPDIVFPRHRVCIFVHGCFWHRHPGCKAATTPKSNERYWRTKFASNVERDHRKTAELTVMGWQVSVIWECETRDPDFIARRLKSIFT